MNGGVILFLVFFISFVLGVLIVKGIETLIKRKNAQKRYLRHLETENQKLKRTLNFCKLELQTRGG
jgi:hypothetical protein